MVNYNYYTIPNKLLRGVAFKESINVTPGGLKEC
jgi:hypothetical protein